MNVTRTRIFSAVSTIILAGFIALAIGCSSSVNTSSSSAQQLYDAAQVNDNQWSLAAARSLYVQARTAFLSAGNTSMADQCRNAIQRIALYEQTYPYTEAQLRPLLKARFPTVPVSRIDGWFLISHCLFMVEL